MNEVVERLASARRVVLAAGAAVVVTTAVTLFPLAAAADDPDTVTTGTADATSDGAVGSDTSSAEDPSAAALVGTWIDTAQEHPGKPFTIRTDANGLSIEWEGRKAPLERVVTDDQRSGERRDAPAGDEQRPRGARITHAFAVIDERVADRHLRIERADHTLLVEVRAVFKDGSGRPDERSKTVYAHHTDFLPNGYTIFFANRFDVSLEKKGVNFDAAVAGPHVVELGNQGNHIFGRIDPKPDLPPHPDHAPGFFLIDSATDEVATGLDRHTWLVRLKAVGVESPRLSAPTRKWPKQF